MHASVKRSMIQSAAQVFFAVDFSKFGKLSLTTISNFEGVEAVITDQKPSAEWERIFAANDVECLYPEGENV